MAMAMTTTTHKIHRHSAVTPTTTTAITTHIHSTVIAAVATTNTAR